MDNQNLELPSLNIAQDTRETVNKSEDASYSHVSQTASDPPNDPPPPRNSLLAKISPFWRDRFIEAGLILSLALYYITGNANLGTGGFFHPNPLFSLPFLLIFPVLCWFRL